MLATGKTLVSAIENLRKKGAREIIVLTIISSKQGIEYVWETLATYPL